MRSFSAAAAALFVAGCGGASQSKVRQVGGLLSIVPATVDFGDVALGKDQTLPVSLQNDGIVPMTVAELDQFADPAFDVQGLPVTLAPGQVAKLSVRYRPPELGTHQRALALVTDSPESARAAVGLHGHAVRGLATLSGNAFDFGAVVVNESASQILALSNNDGHALTSVHIEPPVGGDSAAFTVAPPGDQPLQADQSMQVTIDFKPSRLGDFAAVVAVTPCPTCSPRNVSLFGHGVTRLIDVQPQAIEFGEVLLGATASQPISVKNLSLSPLTVKSLALTGAADIQVAIDGATVPMTLAPGQVVTGVARFQPRTLGDQSAQVSMPVSDGGPGTLALHGIGIGAVVQTTPKSFFLGPTLTGTTRSGSITITNVGLDPHQTTPLRISNISIVSSDPSWTLQTATPIDVGEPGASATVQFSFKPQTAGMSQAVLVIDSNDGLHPEVKVPLAALGRDLQPCTLQITPAGASYDFGPTQVGHSTVEGFELVNTTTPADDCIVADAVLSGSPAFSWPGGVAPDGRTLPPGGRMSVRIQFTPQSVQYYAGAVTFYVSNRGAPSLSVKLTGSGDLSCFFLSPSTVDFGATTLGCGIPGQNTYAVNHCDHTVHVSAISVTGNGFSVATQAPFDVAPQSSSPITVDYAPKATGDDVGTLYVATSENPVAYQAGLTGGAQTPGTVVDQWDQSTPKVDMLIVVDNSGSMAAKQAALQSGLDRLWNRIALANADFHIAVTTSGMEPYTSGWSQCPGGASGGEAGRFFPVDASRPRLLTPQTPDVKNVLFNNINVGLCHWDERFLEPIVAALTPPLSTSTKAPGTPWPSDGDAGFLRDDARLAILVVTDTDDDDKLNNPPPVSGYVQSLIAVKHGAKDLISFAAIVPLSFCSAAEAYPTPRFEQAAAMLNGHLFDACNLADYGSVLENAAGSLLQPLSSFPLSSHPMDPAAIAVTVNGVATTNFSYDATTNRIVFPQGAIPAPGSHITAKYAPTCP